MINQDYSTGYALALFDLAKEEKKIEKYKKDSKTLYEVLANENEIFNFFNAKIIKDNQVENIINKACKNINKNLINFLLILIAKKQTHIINKVIKKLINLINEKLGIKEGIIYSLHKLSNTEITKIETKVKNILKMNKKPELVNKIDYQLISGIKIKIGDQVIEDSMDSRLTLLRNKLLGRDL